MAPSTVIVLALDKTVMTPEFSKRIVENRRRYAERWGYEVFIRDLGEYKMGNPYDFKDAKGKVRGYEKVCLPIISRKKEKKKGRQEGNS